MGVVTNENPGKLQDAFGEECVVDLPNAPNLLDMSVEDAVSMFVSSGAVVEGGFGAERSEAREGKPRLVGGGRGRAARRGGAAKGERREGE